MPNETTRTSPRKLVSEFLSLGREWWDHRISFLISLAVTLAGLFLYLSTFVGERPTPIFEFAKRLELDALDTRFRYRAQWRGTAHDPRIAVVDIDQRSQEVLGRWPFSRAHFARLLDALREDGARVAAFDITFSKPDETAAPIRELRARLEARNKAFHRVEPRLAAELQQLEAEYNTDEQLARSIARFQRVVFGSFFLYSQADLEGLDNATLDRYADLLWRFTMASEALRKDRGKQDWEALIANLEDLNRLPRGTQANIEPLTEAVYTAHGGTGFFNVFPDPDGVVRSMQLVLPYGRSANRAEWDLYPSLDIQTVRLFLGLPEEQVRAQFGETGITEIEIGKGLRLKPDEIGRVGINYRGPVRTYPYHSFADVAQKKFVPGTFRDKIVLVGASATGIGDLRSTPFGGLDYPGVEIHANIIDNILNHNFLQRGPEQVEADLALVLFFGLPLGMWLALVPPRWMWFGILFVLPFTGLVYVAFLRDWWLNFSVPFLTLVTNVLGVSLYRVLFEERQKRKVRGAFQHYLSPEVIRQLLENPELVKPRKTDISVMFTDVRGFTTISEKLDAQELAELLNQYLTEMTEIVFRSQGTLDKYIGDAVMAFWGAPIEIPEHAERACRSGLEMIERLAALRTRWQAEGKPAIDIGVGINSGVASVGNMGSELRYGYTALGDTVNLSSRLEALTREYGTHILVTESTYEAVRSAGFLFRELDLIRVKGKLQPVKIYELLGPQEKVQESTKQRVARFEAAREIYLRREWQAAQDEFQKMLEQWPDDGPSRAFWKRCQDYLFEEPEKNWDGVYVMTHK